MISTAFDLTKHLSGKWLNTSIMAEPTRSFYGFALDPRKPGNFILSFLTKGYEIQSWVSEVFFVSLGRPLNSVYFFAGRDC